MSWQPYVDSLVGSGNVAQAAIFGLDGTELATSPSFKVSATEAKEIIASFRDEGSTLYILGVDVAGVKYEVFRADTHFIHGVKNATGVVVAKAEQCFVIGVYEESMKAHAQQTIGAMADFLLSNHQ
ncbi:hypothetical protein INT45_007554 [Circinella minor]|uniref:Profilin n=1 Tax=Circinella minor TaxID=1195481 RepID=A0A8H7S603_9FUNG|nr:hypothetical protein INT45_007554 [Circinella minor]